jgi:hypothetical protein
MSRAFIPAAIAVVLLAGSASAQSLGEVAAQDRDKKKDTKTKTFTDEDLKKYSPDKDKPEAKASPAPRTGNPIPAAGPRGDNRSAAAQRAAANGARNRETDVGNDSSSQSTPPAPASVSNDSLQAVEKAWRAAAASKRQAVANAQQHVNEIQQKLQGTRHPRAQVIPNQMDGLRQDPYNLYTSDEDRQNLEKQLVEAQAALARAQQEQEQFLTEARMKGALPGWLEP